MKKLYIISVFSHLIFVTGCNSRVAVKDSPTHPTLRTVGQAIVVIPEKREPFRTTGIPLVPFSELLENSRYYSGKMIATTGVLVSVRPNGLSHDKFYLFGSEGSIEQREVFAHAILVYIDKLNQAEENLKLLDGKWVSLTGVFGSGTEARQGDDGSAVWVLNTAHARGTIEVNAIEPKKEQ